MAVIRGVSDGEQPSDDRGHSCTTRASSNRHKRRYNSMLKMMLEHTKTANLLEWITEQRNVAFV